MKYLFKTTATMKPYNCKKWWIDNNIVREYVIEANSINAALQEYKKLVLDDSYISISNNALKNKESMYIDDADGNAIQTGYVITGLYEFYNDNNYKYSNQYIDLWVNINVIKSAFLEG